jgi:cytochrome c556
MSRHSTTSRRRAAAIFLAVLLAAGVAAAHEGATGVVAQRMDIMKQMGQHMKALGTILAGKTAFDQATAKRLAETMHEHCEHVMHMFPPGSDGHHSAANRAAWERLPEFDARMRRFDAAVEELVTVAASGEKTRLEAEFKAVGHECSGCRDDLPAEEMTTQFMPAPGAPSRT